MPALMGSCFKQDKIEDMDKSFCVLCVLLLSLTFGCNRQYSSKKSQRLMDDAMSVVNEQPDSSLRILSMVNRESLSEEDKANEFKSILNTYMPIFKDNVGKLNKDGDVSFINGLSGILFMLATKEKYFNNQ